MSDEDLPHGLPVWFLHIPKCAGTFIAKTFPHLVGPDYVGHIRLSEGLRRFGQDSYVWTVTREPLSRLYSAYRFFKAMSPRHRYYHDHRRMRTAVAPLTFREFAQRLPEDPWFRGYLHMWPQMSFIEDVSRLNLRVDYENLPAGLSRLHDALGARPPAPEVYQTPLASRTTRGLLEPQEEDLLDPVVREVVRDYYSLDYQELGYPLPS